VRLFPGALDRRLAAGADPGADPALSLRARRLTSARHRSDLAVDFDRALRSAQKRSTPFTAAVPLRRREVLAARPWLLQLAERLRSDDPVRAQGVLLAERLLTDGNGPFYLPSSPEDVQRAARAALDAL